MSTVRLSAKKTVDTRYMERTSLSFITAEKITEFSMKLDNFKS